MFHVKHAYCKSKSKERADVLHALRKGLDKEMGMSGMDAMHPSGKYDKQLTLIFRLWSPESSGSVLCIR